MNLYQVEMGWFHKQNSAKAVSFWRGKERKRKPISTSEYILYLIHRNTVHVLICLLKVNVFTRDICVNFGYAREYSYYYYSYYLACLEAQAPNLEKGEARYFKRK